MSDTPIAPEEINDSQDALDINNSENEVVETEVTETIEEQKGRWYAIRTFTSHEDKVKASIELEIQRQNLGDRLFEAAVPKETVFVIRNGKRKTREKNILPGYILVRCELDLKIKDVISNIPSIVNFIGRGNTPEPLQPAEVIRIFGRVEERKEVATIETKFQVGDPVKIIDGPFESFSGTVIDINEEKQKLKVEVQILGRRTPVELDYSQVEVEA